MGKKKSSTPRQASTSATGQPIQRGGEEFLLEKSADTFIVKRNRAAAMDPPAAVAQSPDKFPGLKRDLDYSPRGLEVYRVEAKSRDAAMNELRKNSPDVAWCGHVYLMPGDSGGTLVPSDSIYVELNPEAETDVVNALLQEHGLELVPDAGGDANAYVMRLTRASSENPLKIAQALAKSKAVKLAEPDLIARGRLFIHRPTDDLFPLQWHLENRGGFGLTAGADVSAPLAWDLSRGDSNIIVAVIDDGFDTGHPDFSSTGKIKSPADFGQSDTDPSPVFPIDNHGTACAGVAVADENGSGVVGVASGCCLMGIRWSQTISDADIREQFDHARLNGADVISCSWGVDATFFTLSTSMHRTIHRAATLGRDGKGCVIVFAAGNDNRDIDDPPHTRDGFAIHPDVIAVGASNSRDLRSHYSNFGDRIWVCAPSSGAGGLGIVTTDRRGNQGYQSGDFTTIERFGGTSSATPLVAGVCALMLSVNPDLTGDEVKEILRDTSERIDPDNGNYDDDGHSRLYGFGRVNAHRAVVEAQHRRSDQPVQQVVRFESHPDLAIPDMSPIGVADSIQVNRAATIASVQVDVDITHTYRGDLRVTLVAPDGTAVQLFGRTAPVFDRADNLVGTFTLDNVPALSQLRGKSAMGNWALQVVDLAAADVGTLNSWSLTLGMAVEQTEFEATPGEHIPDNNATGIVSDIEVDAGGALRDIRVKIDITHTYRGDLRVTLQPPAGSDVILHSVDVRESDDDLRQTYTPADTPGLAQLVEQQIDRRGQWRLRVSDNLSDDIGKLNAWSVRLTV